MLTPLAHMNANAQLEITLDANGNFCGANVVDKQDAVTLIPVTEASAGRSSGFAPHMLSDTLSYIAGDFENYCQKDKEKGNAREKFRLYIEQLGSWHESAYTHPKIDAIYRYLNKKVLISDLIKAGIVILTEERFFDEKKINGQPYEKALVRFRVLSAESVQIDSTWEDVTLIHAYTEYFMAKQNGKNDICYLTGKNSCKNRESSEGDHRSELWSKTSFGK